MPSEIHLDVLAVGRKLEAAVAKGKQKVGPGLAFVSTWWSILKVRIISTAFSTSTITSASIPIAPIAAPYAAAAR